MKDSLTTKATSAPYPVSRRERKRTETRQRIFRAAMKLFAERGILDTTVENITEAADVGKGTFFNYFPSKEHVLGMLLQIQLAKVAEALQAAESGQLPIREVLHQFMRRIVEEPARSRQLARGLIVTVSSSEAVRTMMVEALARGRKVLAGVLQRGQQRREIRRDLNALDMARIVQQQVLGTILFWSLNPPANLGTLLDSTFDTFWLGISTRKSGAES
jgi:AcrR family transcriptional regulator